MQRADLTRFFIFLGSPPCRGTHLDKFILLLFWFSGNPAGLWHGLKLKQGLTLNDQELLGFKKYPSGNGDFVIRAKDSRDILALRIKVPEVFIRTWHDTQKILPDKSAATGPRGEYEYWHHAMWADYPKNPYMSKEFIDEGLAAEEWLVKNLALFKFLSDSNEEIAMVEETPESAGLPHRPKWKKASRGCCTS